MATYKVTYTLDGKKWERYINNVISSAEAVEICDMDNEYEYESIYGGEAYELFEELLNSGCDIEVL